MASTYDPIATTTLGSATSTITFSAIASSWTDLRIVVVGTSTSPSSCQLRFNGVSTTTYSSTYFYGNGTSALSSRRTSRSAIDFFEGSLSDTVPAVATIDIFSYANSLRKSCLITGSLDQNGSGQSELIVGTWASATAITSISLIGNGTNWNTGTTATLYGIKNA